MRHARHRDRNRIGVWDAFVSDVLRLRSIRSTYLSWSCCVILVAIIGVLMFIEKGYVGKFGLVGTGMLGLMIGVIPVLGWAAGAGATEYSSDLVSTSFLAIPKRSILLAGRIAAVWLITFTATLILTIVISATGLLLMSAEYRVDAMRSGIVSDTAQQAVAIACLTALATALAIGLRTVVGAVAVILIASEIVPLLSLLLLARLSVNISAVAGFLPLVRTGRADLMSIGPVGWPGVAVTAGWLIVAYTAAAIRIQRDIH